MKGATIVGLAGGLLLLLSALAHALLGWPPLAQALAAAGAAKGLIVATGVLLSVFAWARA